MTYRFKTAIIVFLVVAYPFIGSYLIGIGLSGLVLSLFAAVTFWRGLKAENPTFRFGCLLSSVLLLVAGYFAGTYAVRLIPAFVYLSLATLFGYTLRYPPSLCERLVRLQFAEFKPGIADYLRQLTAVWAAFFLVNTVVCALLPLFAGERVWTIYTGLVVYLLMAMLAVLEFRYRPRRFPDLDIPPAMETIKAMMRQGHKVFKGIGG